VRTIKKYGNRKLYDTKESRYINLSELYDLVRDGQDVKVVSVETKTDITVELLWDAILERGKESDAQQFTTKELSAMIKHGDGTLAGFINNEVKNNG